MMSSSSTESLVNDFYNFIHDRLDELQESLLSSHESCMSTGFISEVLSSLLSFHSEFIILVQNPYFPIVEECVTQYISANIRFWNFCQALNRSIAEMENYCSAGFAIVSSAGGHTQFTPELSRQVMDKIDTCQELIQVLEEESKRVMQETVEPWTECLNEKISVDSKRFNGLKGAVDAMKIVSTLLFLVCGVAYVWSSSSSLLQGYEGHMDSGYDYMVSKARLQRKVAEYIENNEEPGILLVEFQRAKIAVQELRADLEKIILGQDGQHDIQVQPKVENLELCFKSLGCAVTKTLEQLGKAYLQVKDAGEKLKGLEDQIPGRGRPNRDKRIPFWFRDYYILPPTR